VEVTIGWARPSSIGSAIGLLDVDERTRAGTFIRTEDRHRFVTQHALMRLLVGELTGDDPGRLELGWQCPVCGGSDHGRPVLRTDGSVQLSSSRSGRRVVVAVARADEPIGIDVELVMTTSTLAVDEVALTPGERARLLDQPEPKRDLARTAMWVRKEAVLKRAGVGLTVSPAEVDVAASGDVLTDVDVGEHYWCALATARPARVTVADETARLATAVGQL
jgi:4'-phosphopantetheinyl transferase